MTTLAVMKERVARELRRDDLTTEIAEAINVAIDSYKYRRFSFNASMMVDAPATDLEAGNAWMNEAEALIRARAKFEIFTHVTRNTGMAEMIANSIKEALERLRLSVQHLTQATTTAGTLGRMKQRIANEIDRSDMTQQIADAIGTAIEAYKYQRFSFNATSLLEGPTLDGDAGNAWMVQAEALIRNRAKFELYHASSPIQDSKTAAECLALAEKALVELRTSRTHQTSTTAATLGRMKQRIANEIERSDLADEIADAIVSAVEAYEDAEFRFNETRDLTFSTVIDQEFYTDADAASLGLLQKIHYVKLYISDVPTTLRAMEPSEIESASTNGISSGDPTGYCWYGESLRLYPVPYAVRSVRIGANVAVALPADDTTTGNAWMVKAERLIRSRAKLELALHVLSDTPDPEAKGKAADLAARMQVAVAEAYEQLKGKFTKMARVGSGYTVEPMEF